MGKKPTTTTKRRKAVQPQDTSPAPKDGDKAGSSTLVQIATDTIREEILWGRISGGSKVLLVETAARLDMSPIPVREALRNLVAEGLVDPLPQRGFRVRPVSLTDLDDIYKVRLIIEPLAIELAVPRLDAQSLREAERANRRLQEAVSKNQREKPAYLREYHRAFHFSIYNQCGSPWLTEFARQLWRHSERYHRLALYYEPDRVTEHERILTACKEKNVKLATRELTAHIQRSYRRLRSQIEPRLTSVEVIKPTPHR